MIRVEVMMFSFENNPKIMMIITGIMEINNDSHYSALLLHTNWYIPRHKLHIVLMDLW